MNINLKISYKIIYVYYFFLQKINKTFHIFIFLKYIYTISKFKATVAAEWHLYGVT